MKHILGGINCRLDTEEEQIIKLKVATDMNQNGSQRENGGKKKVNKPRIHELRDIKKPNIYAQVSTEKGTHKNV